MLGSRKQEIYKEFLFWSLPLVRNVQTQSWWAHLRRSKLCYNEVELVHNLYISILDADFIEHDIHFLNFQAKEFYENGCVYLCEVNIPPPQ